MQRKGGKKDVPKFKVIFSRERKTHPTLQTDMEIDSNTWQP